MNANRFCSNCGSRAEAGQRFCSNCGSVVDAQAVNPQPTELKAGAGETNIPTVNIGQSGISAGVPDNTTASPASGPNFAQSSSGSMIPPPPPDIYQSDLYQSPTVADFPVQAAQQAIQYQYSLTPPPSAVPDYARPQSKRKGGNVLLLLLALLVIVGAGSFTYLYATGTIKFGNSGSKQQGPASSSVAQNNNTVTAGVTPTISADTPTAGATATTSTTSAPSAATVTFTAPLTFTYADVQVSVMDVKQANTFSDDTDYYDTGTSVLRLDLKESTQTTTADFYNYDYSAFILELPDGTTVASKNSRADSSIDSGVNRLNWLDFEMNSTQDVSKLKLRVGLQTEEQMEIPLKNGVDLSKYQPKVYQVNKSVMYGDLNWTITKVTVKYSALGKQAKSGFVFVIISSKLDNNSSNDSYESVGDNMRLQANGISATNEGNSLPYSVSARQTGVTGDTTFEMPQGATSFTCALLQGSSAGYNPVSIQVQLS